MLINMEEYGFAVETTDISSYHVQYSDVILQWGLQVRYNDYRRDPNIYTCLTLRTKQKQFFTS